MHNELLVQIKAHWRELRGRTYNLLDILQQDDLQLRLPFPDSQPLYYQLWCMLGMTETMVRVLADCEWGGRSCSLPVSGDGVTIEAVRQALQESDRGLMEWLSNTHLLDAVDSSFRSPMSHYFFLTEHEAQHHGQIINILYANHMEPPFSWASQWGLRTAYPSAVSQQ